MQEVEAHWKELYSSPYGRSWQDNRQRCIWLQVGASCVPLSAEVFLKFRKRLRGIDLERMLAPVHAGDEMELISFARWEHFLLLNVLDVVAYRDLVEGTMVMLELNSMIHRQLQQSVHH